MKATDYSSLLGNKILKERSRLLILSYLMAVEDNRATFMMLQKSINLTRGNLSVQIQTLKEADYVTVNKAFKDNKPQTTITITELGIIALRRYLDEMEQIIKAVQSSND